jgi:hypothetical protein
MDDVLEKTHVTEIRARTIDRTADAAPSLRLQSSQVMHLLEERRKILWLGHGHVVAELQHTLLVVRSAAGGRHIGGPRRVECTIHNRKEAKLLAHDACRFRIVLESRDGGQA